MQHLGQGKAVACAQPSRSPAEKGVWSTPGLDDLVIELVNAGLSAHLIADRVNESTNVHVSRSGVIGRLRRLGIKKAAPLLTKGRRSSTVRIVRESGKRSQPRSRPPSSPVTAHLFPPPPSSAVASLTVAACRFPLKEIFCGKTRIVGHSYCFEHYVLAHQAGPHS